MPGNGRRDDGAPLIEAIGRAIPPDGLFDYYLNVRV